MRSSTRRSPRGAPDAGFDAFVAAHASWLDDYALFMALKEAHGGVAWTGLGPRAPRAREPSALASWRERLAARSSAVDIEQCLFFSQFDALRRAAAARGIRIMGDMPIFVAHDCADVWAQPRALPASTTDGRPLVQPACRPTTSARPASCWGNPHLSLGRDARRRLSRGGCDGCRATFELFDIVRIDHFRGFEAYWEVPGDASRPR